MFEPEDTHRQSPSRSERSARQGRTLGPEHRPPSAAGVSAWAGSLAALDGSAGPAEAIELVGALEALKSAAAAAQARLTAELARRAAADAAAAAPAGLDGASRRRLVSQARRDVGAQVALARHDSPARGDRHLGLATALVEEMPAALAALAAGRLSEWRATLLVRETACLSAADRARVDAELAGRCDGRGDRAVAAAARGAAYRADPAAVVARARHAQGERRVGIRPAPDTMAYLTALLPVADAVCAWRSLGLAADAARAGGDPRGRGQLMADALVGAVTGRDPAVGPDVCVDLVMTDAAALGGSDEPARVAGYGPIPAGIARDLLRGRPPADPGQTGPGGRTAQARVWVRRLYADPATGLPVAADIRRRLFPAALRRLLVLRDDVCRTPWCGAPIRHLDHVSPHAAGGATAADNGQGLCEACNLRKQRPGWSARARPGGVIETTTPTGHSYHSRPPPLPGYRPA